MAVEKSIEKYVRIAENCTFIDLTETDSTNTEAKKRARKGAAQWTVITAESQTAGRGRQGKSFFSPEGTGLYMSVILRPRAAGDSVTMLTTAAAVCMAEAIEERFAAEPEIKWVNDLYLDGKKICGILAEASFSGGEVPDFAVLGVGVNVCPPKEGFPEELRESAGYILNEYSENAKYRLAAAFLDRLYKRYDGVFNGEHFGDYRRRCHIEGSPADVIAAGSSYSARVLSLNEDFSLTVETENGEVRRVFFGEVSAKRKT